MELRELFCTNRKCQDFRKKSGKNLGVISRYGKKRYRLIRCKSCGFRFSERRWTIFFGLHTDEGIIRKALICLLNGSSIRKTANEVGIDKDTVQRIWKRVSERWEVALEEFLDDIELNAATFRNLSCLPPPGLERSGISRKKKRTGIYLRAKSEA